MDALRRTPVPDSVPPSRLGWRASRLRARSPAKHRTGALGQCRRAFRESPLPDAEARKSWQAANLGQQLGRI